MNSDSEYYAKDSAQFTTADAKIIGPQLAEMERIGPITARDIVEVARSTNSPLHSYFEWDDSKAAIQYRLGIAREMIKTVRIRYLRQTAPRNPVVAVARMERRETSAKTQATVSVEGPVNSHAATKMWQALSDLRAWEQEYAHYCDMWPAFEQMFLPFINQIHALRLPAGAAKIVITNDGKDSDSRAGARTAEGVS